MLENILAKKNPDELLTEHIINTVNIWKALKKRLENLLFLDNEFWQNSLLSILFHDAGKISKNFQEYHYSHNKYLRHEFISGISLIALNVNYFEKHSLPVWAIFSHHKPLNDNLFIKDINIDILVEKQNLDDFFEFIESIYFRYFKNKFYSEPSHKYYILNKNTNDFYDYFKNKYFQTFKSLKQSDRKKYIFYKAILNESDWLSSGHQTFFNDLEFDIGFLENKIVNELIRQNKIKNKLDFSFREFQLKSNTSKNVIARAPTGSGKTEAALIWASNKIKNSRIFYLLPTKNTTNSIYQRLKNYFGEKNIAVVHSSAFLLQKEEYKGDYLYLNYLKDKTFFKNISVCTIDQVLTQGFNLGYWELKTFHQLNSKIIIDEVHLYEPYVLGLLISTIQYLKNEFGATFYLMSATMPTKLRQILTKTLGENETIFISDKEFLKSARNTFITTEKKVDELYSEIIKNVKNGKKVLCVVNTVNEAIRIYKELYRELENYSIMCYHSRFIVKDRLEKEKTIFTWETSRSKEGCLIIATQVVEVSLDIDYDILFTENAPIDALIQRAGRINRQRKKQDTQVIIFPHTETSSKYVYNTENILQNTFTLLKKNNGRKFSEETLVNFVDEVYKNFDLEEIPEYKSALRIYNEIQKQKHFIKDITADEEVFTRKGLDTVDIIPMKFLEKLSVKSKQIKSKYLVSIKKSKLKYFRRTVDDDGFIYLDACYSFEKGLEFKENNYNTIESF